MDGKTETIENVLKRVTVNEKYRLQTAPFIKRLML